MLRQRRRNARTRRWRQRDVLLAVGVGLTAAVAGVLLSGVLPRGASVVQGSWTGEGGGAAAVAIQPEAPPLAPSVTATAPAKRPSTRPAQPVTGVKAERPPVIPAAPSLVGARQTPQAATPSVVAAPSVPAPPAPAAPLTAAPQAPAAPHAAPVIAATQLPLDGGSAPLTAAPQRPPTPAPAVTAAPGWREVAIEQREPRIRVYNRTGDGGRSRVMLFNGNLRRGFQVKQPYGQINVLPGDYRYELYFAGSALAPLPDQVGVLRCRAHTMYYFHLFTQPASGTIRTDLGDS